MRYFRSFPVGRGWRTMDRRQPAGYGVWVMAGLLLSKPLAAWACPALRALALGAFALLALAASAHTARAEFTVCNQTLDVVNLAVGQEVGAAFQTDGWWTIGANQCANVIRDELANRYIYVYATDVFGQPILNGTTEMCIAKRRFTIRGIDACWQRGHMAAPFFEVDTLKQARWTFFLTGRGP